MRSLPVLFLALLATTTASAQPSIEGPLDQVMSAAVRSDGRVDYGVVRGAQAGNMRAALAAIAAVDPSSLSSNDAKLAFLMNAYNAHVLEAVASRPSARHVERDGLMDALFKTPVAIAGQRLTLNQLEHGILRRQARVDGQATPRSALSLRPSRVDFRIHVGLNCAAVSCPPLQQRAFRASTVNSDLTRLFVAFTSSPDHIRMDGRTLVLSSLLDWFGADFESGDRKLGDFLAVAMPRTRPQYAALRERMVGKTVAQIKADSRTRFEYDWTINRVR